MTLRSEHWYQDLVQSSEDFERSSQPMLLAAVEGLKQLLLSEALPMPPRAIWFEGRDAVTAEFRRGWGHDRTGDWRLEPTRTNGQPAAAAYLRTWDDATFRAFGLVVLTVNATANAPEISDITVFSEPHLVQAFGLASTLT